MPRSNQISSVLFLTPMLNDNSTGRTFSLWLLAEAMGWKSSVISFRGAEVWPPLQETPFADVCKFIDISSRKKQVAFLAEEAKKYDVVIAVKPLPQSLGLALSARRRNPFPLVVDIDDPDLEARLSLTPLWRALAWRVRFARFWLAVRGKNRIGKVASVMVSNPTLAARYGGRLVPHARDDTGRGAPHSRTAPSIAFVGTARTHKGLDVLRQAVALVANEGFTLTVTAESPPDAKPWENWIGTVRFDQGVAIVAQSDIVVIPSLKSLNSVGQLPVKLLDAMLLERAVIVTDVDPLPWAVGGSGVVVAAGQSEAIARELLRLRDPVVRSCLGISMRERALEMFTIDAVTGAFVDACEAAVRGTGTRVGLL